MGKITQEVTVNRWNQAASILAYQIQPERLDRGAMGGRNRGFQGNRWQGGSPTRTAGPQQRSRVIKLSADPGAELVAGSWCRWAGQVAAAGCCTMLPPVMNTSTSTIQRPGPELSPHLLTTDHSHVHISHQPAQLSPASPAQPCSVR